MSSSRAMCCTSELSSNAILVLRAAHRLSSYVGADIDVTHQKLRFKSQSEYSFHILHYEKRLKLLRYTLYLSLFAGIALCASLLFLLMKFAIISSLIFGLYLVLVLAALVTLVYELAVSFEALTEHLEIMRGWKDKF